MVFISQVPCRGFQCENTIKAGERYCEDCRKTKARKTASKDREERPKEYAFYRSDQWLYMRSQVLREELFCRACLPKAFTLAEMVDHIVPLRLSWDRRLDRTNLQALCNGCHARKRAVESRLAAYDSDRGDAMITVVCGPPGSGKSTYVNESFVRGQLIVDLDTIYSALSGCPLFNKPENLLPYVIEVKTAILNKVLLARDKAPATWIVTMGESKLDRERMRRMFKATVVVMETPYDVCMKRIREARGDAQAAAMSSVIKDWWRDYEPDELDIKIRA